MWIFGQKENNVFTCVFCVAETGIILNLAMELESGQYTVVLRVSDTHGMEQDSTVQATVCDCTGTEVTCTGRIAAGTNLPLILGILAAILLLLSKCKISYNENDVWGTLKQISRVSCSLTM